MRTFRASLRKAWKLRITYPTWLLNRLLSPLAWIAIAIYAYVGVADTGQVTAAFESSEGSGDFTGFLVLGQTVYTFFVGLNWRAGMAIQRERWYGTFETLLVAPMNRTAWLLGEAVFGILDTGWTVFAAAVVAIYLFGADFAIPNPGAALLAFVLTLTAVTALGMFVAGFYVLTRSAGPLSNAVQAPVRFFSGSQFPLAALPAALRAASFAIPVTWGLAAVRASLMSGAGFADLWRTYAVLAGFTVLFAWAGVRLIDHTERVAKERGTLHHY
jgi:ABC-2 type transport system permease protein